MKLSQISFCPVAGLAAAVAKTLSGTAVPFCSMLEHHHRLLARIARDALDVVGDRDRACRQPVRSEQRPRRSTPAVGVGVVPPGTSSALLGFGGVTGRWLRSMSVRGNVPVDLWHSAQAESSACGPAACATPEPLMLDWWSRPLPRHASVTPVPVAKLMPSWQAPQASALGTVLPVVAVLGLGRARDRARAVVARVQLRMSCG